MLQLIGSFLHQPVMSLRTGGVVATTRAAIINPNNLKIEGFWCEDFFDRSELILLSSEIRDHVARGFIVNDHDSLSHAEDLVRLKEILDLRFEVYAKPVITINKQKVGKVNDYAVDSESLYIQKLYVGQPLIRSLSGGQVSVDRSQIVEITDRKIVIQELLKPSRVGATASAF